MPAAPSDRGSASDDEPLVLMVAAVQSLLGEPEGWGTPDGYDSVGLAIIDSVWSIGVRYRACAT